MSLKVSSNLGNHETPLGGPATWGLIGGTLALQTDLINYIATIIPNADAFVYKGVIDASTNPNYPLANAGWSYRISVAGKVGGASGISVNVGDLVICNTDSTAAGDQATVGTKWNTFPNSSGVLLKTSSFINFRIDGEGFPVIAGVKTPYIVVPYDCTITGWDLVASGSDTMTADIQYNASISGAPASITGAGTKPNLAATASGSGTTMTGWTTALSAGGVITVNVTVAPVTATWFILKLRVA